MEGHQGTPDLPQTGPGAPTRDTTLCTDVLTQLADGTQDKNYSAYSPYLEGGDIGAGLATAQSASSVRSTGGAAAGSAFHQEGLAAPQERLGAAYAPPTCMATPFGVALTRPRMDGGVASGIFDLAGQALPPGDPAATPGCLGAAFAAPTSLSAAASAQRPGDGQPIGGGVAGARLDFGGGVGAFGSAEGGSAALPERLGAAFAAPTGMQAATTPAQQQGVGRFSGRSAAGAQPNLSDPDGVFGSAEGARGAGASRTSLGSGSMRPARLSACAAGGASSADAGFGAQPAGLAVGGTPCQGGSAFGWPSAASPLPGRATAQVQAVSGAAAPAVSAEVGGVGGAMDDLALVQELEALTPWELVARVDELAGQAGPKKSFVHQVYQAVAAVGLNPAAGVVAALRHPPLDAETRAITLALWQGALLRWDMGDSEDGFQGTAGAATWARCAAEGAGTVALIRQIQHRELRALAREASETLAAAGVSPAGAVHIIRAQPPFCSKQAAIRALRSALKEHQAQQGKSFVPFDFARFWAEASSSLHAVLRPAVPSGCGSAGADTPGAARMGPAPTPSTDTSSTPGPGAALLQAPPDTGAARMSASGARDEARVAQLQSLYQQHDACTVELQQLLQQQASRPGPRSPSAPVPGEPPAPQQAAQMALLLQQVLEQNQSQQQQQQAQMAQLQAQSQQQQAQQAQMAQMLQQQAALIQRLTGQAATAQAASALAQLQQGAPVLPDALSGERAPVGLAAEPVPMVGGSALFAPPGALCPQPLGPRDGGGGDPAASSSGGGGAVLPAAGGAAGRASAASETPPAWYPDSPLAVAAELARSMGPLLRDVRQEAKAADVLRDSVPTDAAVVRTMMKHMMANVPARLSACLPQTEADAAATWAQHRASFLSHLLVWWGHLVRGGADARQAADGNVRDLVLDVMRAHSMFRQYLDTLVALGRAARSPEEAVVKYIRLADSIFLTQPRGVGATLDTAEWVERETIWDLWRKLRELAARSGGDGAAARAVTIWVARLETKRDDMRVVQAVRDAIGDVLDHFRQAVQEADVDTIEQQLRLHSKGGVNGTVLRYVTARDDRNVAQRRSVCMARESVAHEGVARLRVCEEGDGLEGPHEAYFGAAGAPGRKKVPGFGNWELWKREGVVGADETSYNPGAQDGMWGLDCPRCSALQSDGGGLLYTAEISMTDHMASLGAAPGKQVSFKPPKQGTLIRHYKARCPCIWADAFQHANPEVAAAISTNEHRKLLDKEKGARRG